MSERSVVIDDRELARAMRKAPEEVGRQLRVKFERGVLETAREARKNAPKASSLLTNSIRGIMHGAFEGEVAPGVDYGPMVEDGTGPGGRPSIRTLTDWIMVRHIIPRDPMMNHIDLAYLLRRSIAMKGTPKQPYLEPAADFAESRLPELLRAGASIGLKEAGFR